MTTDLRIVIDAFTCKKHGVDPVSYRNALKSSDHFREAEIAIEDSNPLQADYFVNGGLIQMHFFGTPSDQDELYEVARELFQQQKRAT